MCSSDLAEIVATDISETPFPLARRLGADRCINTAADPAALAAYGQDKGTFDVLLECSGNQAALVSAFETLKPLARIVQVGLGGAVTLPMNVLVAKEFELVGTFRFQEEFGLAADLIGRRAVDLSPLLSATLPIERSVEAFELASDRSRAMKVQLQFS